MLKKIIIAGFSALLCMKSFADGDTFGQEIPLIWSPIITLSGGPAWTTPGQALYLYPQFPFPQVNYYFPTNGSSTITTGEVFFGLRHFVVPNLIGELGLGIAGATDADISGVVNVEGIPQVGVYKYKVDHGRIELKGKLISSRYVLQPYISGSFGIGINNSHDFRAESFIPFLFYPAWYGNQANIAFSYTLGLGLQYVLNSHWQVGLGYEFADWGTSQLGPDNSTLVNGPNLTHLYTNELLFSLSYLF